MHKKTRTGETEMCTQLVYCRQRAALRNSRAEWWNRSR